MHVFWFDLESTCITKPTQHNSLLSREEKHHLIMVGQKDNLKLLIRSKRDFHFFHKQKKIDDEVKEITESRDKKGEKRRLREVLEFVTLKS